MRTIKEICSMSSNEGMNEREYDIFDAYTTNLRWAWENWEDVITQPFWGGPEKPENPTNSFEEDYYHNEDFDQYGDTLYTYNVVFNDEYNSNDKGFKSSLEDCKNYIEINNGSNESYFEDYKGGTVSVVCNETGEEVYSTIVK